MKKILSLLLAFAVCVSLCACGGSEAQIDSDESSPADDLTPEEAIVGKWYYNTGITVWNFVFNEDGSCRYWSGNKESNHSTYSLRDNVLTIEGLDWELAYALSDGEFEWYLTHEDGDKWYFTKDDSYDPNAITSLELTSAMVDEIEAEIESEDFETLILFYEQLTFESDKDFTFTDLEISNHKKTSQYEYTAFGTIYAEDNYGDLYKQNVDIVFTAEEDSEEDSGYSIKWDIEFVIED